MWINKKARKESREIQRNPERFPQVKNYNPQKTDILRNFHIFTRPTTNNKINYVVCIK